MPNNGKRIFKSNPPNSKKAMLSPTINKRFSHKESFLIRKINEMRKPGNKIHVQKEISVVVQRKLTCVSSSTLARRSTPSNTEKSVFLPNVIIESPYTPFLWNLERFPMNKSVLFVLIKCLNGA